MTSLDRIIIGIALVGGGLLAMSNERARAVGAVFVLWSGIVFFLTALLRGP